ncbi:MAG: hypothetical protein HQM16_17085 [Deltaproteobacteria bacterium]|nr:hypothetical protein [Deltaproteobacteria bacterium]
MRYSILKFLLLLSLALPWHSATAGSKCFAEEYMVLSVPQARPVWIDKLRFSENGYEYFVALSTQNTRIESGINTAVDNANSAVLEAVGQVIQTKHESLMTLTADDVRKSLGSKGATAYFRHKKREAVYYEKWATLKNCKKEYYYNVWALMSVPSHELKVEADKAAIFLLNLQESENQGIAEGLLPDANATHIQEVPEAPPTLPVDNMPAENFDPPSEFKCGNVTLMGGINYPTGSYKDENGDFKKWGFNIIVDGEFGVTPNVCMGVGIGYASIRTTEGKTGHMMPIPVRAVVKLPIGRNHAVIPWFGAEVGLVVLYGFNNETETELNNATGRIETNPKGEFALWTAGVAGLDIKIQRNLYLTMSGAYVPVISDDTLQFVMGRAGVRYYFK